MPRVARPNPVSLRQPAWGFVLAAGLLAATAAPLPAATPRDTLLRYVPDKVGFCLVLQDLRAHGEALAASPFWEQFRKSELGKALADAKELKDLAKIEQDLKGLTGLDFKQLRDDVFGDALILAYNPGPPGMPEKEQGLFLLHAREPKVLRKLVETLLARQKEAGDPLELTERRYNGETYYKRVDKKDTSYHYLDGPILIVANQEETIRQALDGARAAKEDAEPPLARRFRRLGAQDALLALWIDPRAFDAELEAKGKNAGNAAFVKAFLPYWKATDGIVLSATLDKELQIALGVQARTDELPPAARKLLKEASRPSDLWAAFPPDAMLAVAGCLDLGALFQVLEEFMPEPDRKQARDNLNRTLGAQLGKDFFTEVLPNLGPDVGLCVVAPPDDKSWFPDQILALRVGVGDEAAPVDKALLSAAQFFAHLAVAGYNKANPDKPRMVLKTALQGKREVYYLVGDGVFPPGVQPGFTLHGGYFLFGSSPEAIRRFADALAAAPKPPAPGEAVPLLRVSFKAFRAYAVRHREALAAFVAEQNHLSKDEAKQRLNGLLLGLEFFDRLEIARRGEPGQVLLTLRLRTARPLRK